MRASEFCEDKSLGYALSQHGTHLHKKERSKNIQPGTKDWFKLWFARPFLTHEKPPKGK
jgi:hypothetical protein